MAAPFQPNPFMSHRLHPRIIPNPSGPGWPRVWCDSRGDLGCLLEHAKAAGYRLDGLADRLECCARCLGSEFRRVFGITAKQWLVQARALECRRRMCGDESIAEIAYSVGFSHPKELSREFMKIYRISPSEYRMRENQRNPDNAGKSLKDNGRRKTEDGRRE
jgi:AraC-like DNA-binding protein